MKNKSVPCKKSDKLVKDLKRDVKPLDLEKPIKDCEKAQATERKRVRLPEETCKPMSGVEEALEELYRERRLDEERLKRKYKL